MFTPFAFVQTPGGGAGPSYQPLTTAFAAASGISDATTLNSLNAFEIGLANYSISTGSFYAIYPFVGASSGSMAWNFVNTTQYKLTYTGSLTFTTGGLAAAGSPKNGSVSSIPGNLWNTGSGHSYFYLTDNTANTANFQSQVGLNGDLSNPNLTQYYQNWFGSGKLSYPVDVAVPPNVNGSITVSLTVQKGGYYLNRTANNSMKAFYNGSQTGATNTTVATGRSYATYTTPIQFLARGSNVDTTAQQRIGWGSLSAALTETEAANYHTLVVAFQTSMSRA
jgi:hypothetical protein